MNRTASQDSDVRRRPCVWHSSYMKLENPVEKIPEFVDGVPVSNRNGHGIGVKSIIYYVDQLNGQCHFSITDHCFVLRIII